MSSLKIVSNTLRTIDDVAKKFNIDTRKLALACENHPILRGRISLKGKEKVVELTSLQPLVYLAASMATGPIAAVAILGELDDGESYNVSPLLSQNTKTLFKVPVESTGGSSVLGDVVGIDLLNTALKHKLDVDDSIDFASRALVASGMWQADDVEAAKNLAKISGLSVVIEAENLITEPEKGFYGVSSLASYAKVPTKDFNKHLKALGYQERWIDSRGAKIWVPTELGEEHCIRRDTVQLVGRHMVNSGVLNWKGHVIEEVLAMLKVGCNTVQKINAKKEDITLKRA